MGTILAAQMNIPITRSMEKYLGIPIISGRVNNSVFNDAINCLHKQLTNWKASTLSQAGRKILIQANLNSKVGYLMQSFLLPKGILDQIDKINKLFFWNKLQTDQYHPLIGWDRICSSLDEGGLGIKTAEQMNIALQMKLIWKIKTEPSNIWVKLIQEKYLKGIDILEFCKKINISWQFGRLLNLTNLFQKGIRWELGNGKQIDFWKDTWLGNLPLYNYRDPNNNSTEKVCNFFNTNKAWDIPKLQNILPNSVVSDIITKRIPICEIDDKLIWTSTLNGSFYCENNK